MACDCPSTSHMYRGNAHLGEELSFCLTCLAKAVAKLDSSFVVTSHKFTAEPLPYHYDEVGKWVVDKDWVSKHPDVIAKRTKLGITDVPRPEPVA
jgi:hypothetical protein